MVNDTLASRPTNSHFVVQQLLLLLLLLFLLQSFLHPHAAICFIVLSFFKKENIFCLKNELGKDNSPSPLQYLFNLFRLVFFQNMGSDVTNKEGELSQRRYVRKLSLFFYSILIFSLLVSVLVYAYTRRWIPVSPFLLL